MGQLVSLRIMITLVYLAHTENFRLAKIRVTGLKKENLLQKTSHTQRPLWL